MRISTSRALRIRQATESDIEPLTRTMVAAFSDTPDGEWFEWLIPDRGLRVAATERFYAEVIADAVRPGRRSAWCTTDYSAVSVWHWSTSSALRAIYDERLTELCPGFTERIELLELTLRQRQPESTYLHLAYLGVAPTEQGKEDGQVLLRDRLKVLDIAEMPSYVVAASSPSRALYERFGYADSGTPIELPNGLSLYPMWREFRSAGSGS
jgi:hypothetical protein